MKWKILIVDDDAAIAGLTKEYLEAKGCEVTFASNGVKGLKLFQSGKFDLCILDVLADRMMFGDYLIAPAHSPEDHFNSQVQLLQTKWLSQVIIGSQHEPLNALVLL